jgi:hypothetical protein
VSDSNITLLRASLSSPGTGEDGAVEAVHAEHGSTMTASNVTGEGLSQKLDTWSKIRVPHPASSAPLSLAQPRHLLPSREKAVKHMLARMGLHRDDGAKNGSARAVIFYKLLKRVCYASPNPARNVSALASVSARASGAILSQVE